MKKLISVILILTMLLIPVSASAESQEADPTLIKMGDINKDSKISAMDARLILRYSAKLDKEELSPYSADADGNGKINAADARMVLRVAAGLSQFICGFDGKGVPCAVNTLLGNKYTVEARYDETGTGKGVKSDIVLAADGDNTYLEFDAKTGIGMLLLDKQLYAVMQKDDIKFAIPITDALIDAMGKDGEFSDPDFILDADTMKQVTQMITSLISSDIEKPEKTMLDDEEVYCYSYTKNGASLLLYVDMMGSLINISTAADGNALSLIEFTKLSGDKPSGFFDISNYEVLELF